jgi:ubiquilin
MADEDTTGGAGEESEQQVTFNVKSSSDAKFVLTVSVNTTIGDLKQKLSTDEYASIPAERQRLIYSGRVLKDADTVGAVKIKDGNTVHLVRGAESNQRQNPANQGGAAVPPGAGQPASHVPTNIAAGQGAGNPLAQLTGARYAGFHGLPGADSFGADGGMGAPPNPEQMLQLLDDPNFAQQMNEAMNNPAVIDMLRNNPMIRNNPQMRAVIENPEMRRLMLNPEMIRMQMQMERAMGGGGGLGGAGGANSFPMPGATDTTPAPAGGEQNAATGTTGAAPANPFAALFPGGAGGATSNTNTPNTNPAAGANPFGSLFGNAAQPGGGGQPNYMQQMAQQMMQNPQMMQQMMQMFNGGGGGGGAGGAAGEGGFNPFAAFGGAAPESQAPPDNRPPEERYAEQLRQLNDMGFFEFERNVQALRRSGGSVQGAIEYLLSN